MTVRVRFAPNPSGDLHVGLARTVLFNWLFARNNGGKFILRIEDTDPAAAKPEFIEPILDALRWLGLDWDEGPDVGGPHGPYRQSERKELHLEALQRLIDAGVLYRCYCTREDVAARGTKTGYDRFCRTRTDQPDAPHALRFAVPEGRDVVVNDLIRGEVRTPFGEMQDFIVARSDASPTFVLANAADDTAMEITHAIRGNDLLSAAAQTTLLFEALGAEPPKYAHVPLILGPDKAKLSKRRLATGVHAFRSAGFLPDAMVNYLALLGWSPGDETELMSRDELVERFSFDGVVASPAIFDRQKLEWMNSEYLKTLSIDDFIAGVMELAPETDADVLRRALDLEMVQSRVRTLSEVAEAIRYLHDRPAIEQAAKEKWLGADEATKTLEAVADRLGTVEPWEPEAIKTAVQATISELGLHRRKGPKPIFVAIAGKETALPLFESIYLIGREESVARLRRPAS